MSVDQTLLTASSRNHRLCEPVRGDARLPSPRRHASEVFFSVFVFLSLFSERSLDEGVEWEMRPVLVALTATIVVVLLACSARESEGLPWEDAVRAHMNRQLPPRHPWASVT